MLEGHGDDGYRQGKEIAADFSTNVWFGGAPAGLKQYLFEAWEKVQRYPEVLGESLSRKIAQHYDLDPVQLLTVNGSTESIYLVAHAFRRKRATILIPSFAEYEDACRSQDMDISFISWAELHAGMQLDTDVFFICNPNNPTGEVCSYLAELIRSHPQVCFVVDEAFIEFTLSIESVLQFVNEFDNLIVLRSMTKAYAIPGLRLGYIAAAPGCIELLKGGKLPWTVNALALEAGHFIFDNFDRLHLPLLQVLRDKDIFIQQLEATGLLSIYPGHTHFFLAETRIKNAALLKQFLLDEAGLLIRDASNFRGLGPGFVRIATLTDKKNELLISALKSWK